MVVLILATDINTFEKRQAIQTSLDILVGMGNWSIDLGDVDKVLRVVAETDILFSVIDLLQQYCFNSCLMDVFDTVESPCFKEDAQLTFC